MVKKLATLIVLWELFTSFQIHVLCTKKNAGHIKDHRAFNRNAEYYNKFSAERDRNFSNIDLIETILELRKPYMEVKSLHDLNFAMRRIRPRLNYTHEQSYNSIVKAGHKWCSITRDDWGCYGDEYTEFLRNLEPFDDKKYNFNSLKPGIRIYADGNSYFDQMIDTIVCELNAKVWLLIKDSTCSENSLLAYFNESDTLLLLNGNDYAFNLDVDYTINWLHKVQFDPDVILLGRANLRIAVGAAGYNGNMYLAERGGELLREFPWSVFILFPSHFANIPDTCVANTCKMHHGHQCLPSGIVRPAEQLVKRINYELSFKRLEN